MSLLKDLDKEQLAVVNSKHNRLFINAGPGSGKTRVVVALVEKLVKQKGIKPHKITLCTFTNVGADTMKSRLKKCLGKENAEKIKVNTIHGLALNFLIRQGLVNEDGLLPDTIKDNIFNDLGIKTDADKWAFNRHECSMNPLNTKGRKSNAANLLHKFYAYLEKYNLWSHDYCINKMISILKEDRKELAKLWNSIEYLFVDEYQDCNGNQIELLQLLANRKEAKNILFVGDPDQMIYDWRGASAHFSTNISKFFRGIQIKSLVNNYRSTTRIVDFANNLISKEPKRLIKTIVAVSEDDGVVKYQNFLTKSEQASYIVGLVKKCKNKDIAILCPTHKCCEVIEDEFISEGIEYRRICKDDEEKKIEHNIPVIMTSFASKGEEFHTVFVPYVNNYNYPEKKRRLLYVAITRAKRKLYITSCEEQYTSNDRLIKSNTAPSSLLDDMRII